MAERDIVVVTVPGALETPLALQRLAQAGDYDALVALGAVIRGETYHFEIVANESAAGVAERAARVRHPDRQRHPDHRHRRAGATRAPTRRASRRRRRRSSSRTCWMRSMICSRDVSGDEDQPAPARPRIRAAGTLPAAAVGQRGAGDPRAARRRERLRAGRPAYFDELWAGVTADESALVERAVAAARPVGGRSSRRSSARSSSSAPGNLQHRLEIPYRVVINEAVELAKSYGGTDGHKFVNGVLDKVATDLRGDEIRALAAERAAGAAG